ncbi:AAA family ATPase [Zoogloea sp.]|uniref:AAA family ATPase n=1 Tax=Zoogloea sp. TaxID=49181 RepID=UPI002619FFE8|nr:MoxR family ATPase [uncultured Zoogloea sp.]
MSQAPSPQPVLARLAELHPGQVCHLPATDASSEAWHQWSQPEIDALRLAYAAGRPLLVRGEPGTGKTQLARAAAEWLDWRLQAETIHPRFEAHELRYRFDAVRRLADAQAGEQELDKKAERYWRPGVLWKAYGWESAERFLPDAEKIAEPEGHVVLIDEIDKADSDLPNSLLEVLAQRSFHVEPVLAPIGGPSVQPPLVIITTNEERDLPAAFLRRCIVLSLDGGKDYAAWLVERGKAHFGKQPKIEGRELPLIDDTILQAAADQLVTDREAVASLNLPKPGLAEYLDLLYALKTLFEHEADAATRTAQQKAWLIRLSAYGYLKHAVDNPASSAHQPTQAQQRMGATDAPPAG